MKIVRGFSDIIGKTNFLKNPRFKIDQRGVYAVPYFVPIKEGDFVTDCWQLTRCTVKNLSASFVVTHPANGAIELFGEGSAGETMKFQNSWSDYDKYLLLGDEYYGHSTAELTGMVCAIPYFPTQNLPGSVPAELSVMPARNNSNIYYSFNRPARLDIYKTRVAICAIRTLNNFTHPFEFSITLLASGKFRYVVFGTQMVHGMHTDLSGLNTNIDYADDLIRCKRHYQKGQERYTALGVSNGSSYILHSRVDFPVEMAGTPTVAYTNPVVYEEGAGDTNVESSYTKTISNVTSKGFDITVSKSASGAKPRLLQIDWTASV